MMALPRHPKLMQRLCDELSADRPSLWSKRVRAREIMNRAAPWSRPDEKVYQTLGAYLR
jgi:hypothetical protein